MPRQSKGPHISWEKPQLRPDGSVKVKGCWTIRDGQRKRRLGLALEEKEAAEKALAEYLAEKHQPDRDNSKAPSSIPVADVLAIYLVDAEQRQGERTWEKTAQRIGILREFWGDKLLSEVNGKTCRDYVKLRTSQPWRSAKPAKTGKPPRMVTAQGARRELEDLRAAINYHRGEGLCDRVVEVWLPERSAPREVFLTRKEAAKLLWTAWTMREQQKACHDGKEGGEKKPTRKRPNKHIARFILLALYTGTRHNAVLGASFTPGPDRGWIDLENGIFHRLRQGRPKTKKQQPPVRIPNRLLAHLRRWHRLGIAKDAPVEWKGGPIEECSTGFELVVAAAGLGKHVTPHTLRHTAATWLMAAGYDRWETSGFVGMSPQTLETVYAKHSPDYQVGFADADFKPKKKLAKAH